MSTTREAARRLREGNPVTDSAFAGARDDGLGQATFRDIIASAAEPAPNPRRPSRRRVLLPIGAMAAAAAVAVLVVLLPGPAPLTRPLHTPWQAARPLPYTPVRHGGPAGTWRLVSYLTRQGWRRNTTGPEPGNLTCPTATTCYVQGDNAASASGPADMDSLYVSTDGAVSWDVLPLPSGLTFTSALSCASAVNCAAGALLNGQPVLAVTSDGAHSWTLDSLPAGPSQIFQLSCPTTTTCVGLATASAILPGVVFYPPYIGTRFLITTDGGARFTTSASPPGESMVNLACPTARDCVAVGARNRDRSARYANEPGVVAITHDGGATWSSATLPQNQGLFPPLTCVDTNHCYTLGQFIATRFHGGSFSTASDLLASADGGRTWTVRRLPASLPTPQLFGLACASDRTCYASGTEDIPQHFAGGAVNESSAMVLTTSNGGLTWSRVTFATPAQTPRGMDIDAFMAIGEIQCPRPGTCVALGVSDQGSKTTPVYSTTAVP